MSPTPSRATSRLPDSQGLPSAMGLAAYSALSLSLAMAMLPIYMIAPKFYGDTLGVSLGMLGAALFAVRLVDTVQDPLIGRLVDWLGGVPRGWSGLMVVGAVLLAGGFVLLFHVPTGLSEGSIVVWMAGALVLVYTAHSLMNVCYLSWGARLTDDSGARARVTGWREAAGVVGVVVASVVPAVWVAGDGAERAYGAFAWVFAAILGITLAIMLLGSPRPRIAQVSRFNAIRAHHSDDSVLVSRWSRLMAPWRTALGRKAVGPDRWLWRLYAFYLFNATAAALPATLILFYVEDVIERPDQVGLFLGAYFLAGLLVFGFWVRVSDCLGKARTWVLGSLIAGIGLCIAAFLGAGDTTAYLVVCVLTGTALGVDLALPPAMLADAIRPDQRASTGLYFGVWAFVAKFALAVSAGVSLPMLGALGYEPGQPATATSLAFVYAFTPIVFKSMAAACLGRRLISPDPTGQSSQTESTHSRTD